MERDNSELRFHVCLFQPEIPANTGNIGRLCVGVGAELHIIKPMRFLLTDKYLKRAGLDYWKNLKVRIHDSYEDFIECFNSENVYYFSTKGKMNYTEVLYKPGDVLVFGPETKGIPKHILERFYEQTCRIPMTEKLRSINLSNSVAIALYEAWRQVGFNSKALIGG